MPGGAFGCTAVVDRHLYATIATHIAFVKEIVCPPQRSITVEEAGSPYIEHNGIFFGGIEILWFVDPGIEGDVVFGGHLRYSISTLSSTFIVAANALWRVDGFIVGQM